MRRWKSQTWPKTIKKSTHNLRRPAVKHLRYGISNVLLHTHAHTHCTCKSQWSSSLLHVCSGDHVYILHIYVHMCLNVCVRLDWLMSASHCSQHASLTATGNRNSGNLLKNWTPLLEYKHNGYKNEVHWFVIFIASSPEFLHCSCFLHSAPGTALTVTLTVRSSGWPMNKIILHPKREILLLILMFF